MSEKLRVGLAARIEAYFERNADEYLTEEDARHKFGATHEQMLVALKRLRALGTVETVKVLRRKA